MTARADLARGISTLLICALGTVSLWALRVPTPRWADLMTAGSSTVLIDAVVFALWGASTVTAAYLVLASALQMVAAACARRSRAPRLRRAAARLTPRWMAVATVSVVTGTSWVAPAAGATGAVAGDGERRPDVVMEVVTDEDGRGAEAPRTMLPWASVLRGEQAPTSVTSSTVPSAPAPTITSGTNTSRSADLPPSTSVATNTVPAGTSGPPTAATPRVAPRLEAVDEVPPAETGSPPGADQLPPPLVVEIGPGAPSSIADRHVVVAGESFWTIAEHVARERALPVPVASYWRLLVEANRDRLLDRTDPDLIHPGQELVVP